MECAYCVVIVLHLINVLLIFVMESFSLVLRCFIDGICIVDLEHATKTMNGAMVHLLVVMLLKNS